MVDLEAEFERALAVYDGTNFETLPPRDQILITIWGLEADVNNGGFDQFYFNSYGDLALFAPVALDQIGAPAMAALVREANSYFGDDGPPRDRDLRQKRLLALTEKHDDLFGQLDERFFEYPDDIAGLLAAFLTALS